jgi:hypothetical protein
VIVPFVMVVTPVVTLAMILAMIIAMNIPMILFMTAALGMIVEAVLALVSRHVFVVVPVIADEVDPPATGVVLRTMLSPVLLVPRRHVKVNRRSRNEFRRLLDHHGLRIDQLWRRSIADIDLTKESRLADADRHTYVAGKYRTDTNPKQRSSENFRHCHHLLH